jgi:hypothetical protein
MQHRGSVGKVDNKAGFRENIPADEDIMGLCERRKSNDIKFYIHTWEEKADFEVVGGNWFPASLVDHAGVDWFQSQPRCESGANPRTSRAGVNKRQDVEQAFGAAGFSDPNGSARAMADQVLDRLLKADLGPDGFFVICHRDSFVSKESA